MPSDPYAWVGTCRPLPRAAQLRLARRARAGDRAALDALVRSVAPLLLMLARQRTASRPTHTEDVFAEGLLAATVAVRDFDWRIGRNVAAFLAWRARSAMADYMQTYRGGRADAPLVDAPLAITENDRRTLRDTIEADGAGPEADLEACERVEAVRRHASAAVKGLPRRQRVLRVLLGQVGTVEAAQAAGISHQAMSEFVATAHQRLALSLRLEAAAQG